MEIFGYKQKVCSPEGLMQMREVTFLASPAMLRNLAAFFSATADTMERMGEDFDHIHMENPIPELKNKQPQIIIAKAKKAS